jgi:hypothetical protein
MYSKIKAMFSSKTEKDESNQESHQDLDVEDQVESLKLKKK